MNRPFHLRRNDETPRVEIVPLIDVVFLVLTFFIYAVVLMIPARVLPMRLQALAGGTQGEPLPAVTISIDAAGTVAVDQAPAALDRLAETVRAAVDANPGAVVYIAWEETGTTDRLPLLGEVMDRLSNLGLDIRLVGRPRGGG